MKLPTRFIPKRILERLEGEGSTSPRDAMLSPKRKASTLTQISEWMDAERSKQAHDSIHDVLEGKVADLLRTPDDQLEMLLEWICPDLDPDDPPPSLADFPLSGPINDSRGVSNEIQSRVIFTERVCFHQLLVLVLKKKKKKECCVHVVVIEGRGFKDRGRFGSYRRTNRAS